MTSSYQALIHHSISFLSDEITRLQSQYEDLRSQFDGGEGSAPPTNLSKPNDPSLSQDFAAASSRTPRPSKQRSSSLRRQPKSPTPKSVRFRDEPTDPHSPDDENRAALFDRPYSDEPDADPSTAAGHAGLSNQQIHAYHKQVLRDQDDQLDRLGESIGRQRDLSIQMGDELDEQAVLLDDVDQSVDRHQGALDRGNARIKTISRKARDNWSWLTIGILIFILLLLIFLLKT